MEATIVILEGDGIGPEVTAEARKILTAVADRFGHTIEFDHQMIGGRSIDELGTSLPDETVEAAARAEAVLLGAVGGPKWDDPGMPDRPERGVLALRKSLDLFANLRPVKLQPQLLSASTIKEETLEGVDLLVVRELTGGIYFGSRKEADDNFEAYDTMVYTRPEIERVVRLAADSAMERNRRLASVDKANVLASSRLWRSVATETLSDFPELEVEHILVDAMAMHLIRRPADFDVIVAGNLFGDILTDEASMLAGSMGMLPSASLGASEDGSTLGLYEPIHGTAPDIAGQGVANPMAMILSAALMLRYSLGLENEASTIEEAVTDTLAAGHRSADLAGEGEDSLSTEALGSLIADAVASG